MIFFATFEAMCSQIWDATLFTWRKILHSTWLLTLVLLVTSFEIRKDEKPKTVWASFVSRRSTVSLLLIYIRVLVRYIADKIDLEGCKKAWYFIFKSHFKKLDVVFYLLAELGPNVVKWHEILITISQRVKFGVLQFPSTGNKFIDFLPFLFEFGAYTAFFRIDINLNKYFLNNFAHQHAGQLVTVVFFSAISFCPSEISSWPLYDEIINAAHSSIRLHYPAISYLGTQTAIFFNHPFLAQVSICQSFRTPVW